MIRLPAVPTVKALDEAASCRSFLLRWRIVPFSTGRFPRCARVSAVTRDFTAPPKGKLVGLEIVRGLAALVVVYSHVFLLKLLPATGFELPGQFAPEAVIIFFVLSGTVITLSQQNKVRENDRRVAVLTYLKARLLRLYPIYVLGLGIAVVVQFLETGIGMAFGTLAGNLLFLQSLAGYIVPSPTFNLPLWSLSNEVCYYLIFAAVLLYPRVWVLWMLAAIVCGTVLWPIGLVGAPGFLVFLLGLSLPWIMGYLLVVNRHALPSVSIPLGFSFFVTGLAYSRVPLFDSQYDPFRLTVFAAFCCPLILSLVQGNAAAQDPKQHRGLRLAAALPAIIALWTVSPSIIPVKAALTSAALLFALIDLAWISAALRPLTILVPVLAYLGSISYALYALHFPLIYLANSHLQSLHPTARFVAFAVAVLALSHLMERIVQPSLAKRLRRRADPPAVQ